MAPRPNLFVIGAAKCGTTSLCELLAQHPDIFVSDPKEPGWFSSGRPRIVTSAEGYAALFEGAEGYAVVAEGTTSYSMAGLQPGIAERIRAYSPDARIVYMVRDPLRRMESMWLQWREMGSTRSSFRDTLRDDPALIHGSLYHQNLAAYRAAFGPASVKLVFFEEFARAPSESLREVLAFLQVSPFEYDDVARVRNAWTEKREDGPLLRWFRDLPGYGRTRDLLLPVRARERMKQLVTRPLTRRPEWDAETLQWVLDRIRPDAEALLAEEGRPAEYWSMTPSSRST